jgi:outer membrane cobalamin receptor
MGLFHISHESPADLIFNFCKNFQFSQYLLASSLFLVSLLSLADENARVTLEPMTILGSSTSDDMNVSFPSQNATIFEQDKLEIGHERNLDDILEGEPGVAITKQYSVGRLYLRGESGMGTLTLDGLPVPDGTPNTINLNSQIPDGLESVEVTRGASVASRPFSALGGTIRTVSREAKDNSAHVRVEGGTFGTLRETLKANLVHGKARLAVTANNLDMFDGAYQASTKNGNTERDPLHNTQVLFRTDVDITKDTSWQSSMFYRNSLNNNDGRVSRNGLVQLNDSSGTSNDEVWMTQSTLTTRINDTWTSKLQLGYVQNYLRGKRFSTDVPNTMRTNLYLARWENTQRLWTNARDSIHLIWGAVERHEMGENTIFADERNNLAGFLDSRFTFGNVSGDVGVRYESYDSVNDEALFHLGAAWQINQTVKWLVNVGNGFRLPSYSEWLYEQPGKVFFALKPESNITGDMGFEWQALSNLKLKATGFYSRYENLITMTWVPRQKAGTCSATCVDSIANAAIAGLESSGEMTLDKNLRGGFSYTYTDTENLANHLELPLRAAHTGKIWGEWTLPFAPITLWAEGIYKSKSYNDLANLMPIGDGFRVNIQANYHVAPGVDLYVRGENLSDNQTPNMYSYNQTGAAVYGGISVTAFSFP